MCARERERERERERALPPLGVPCAFAHSQSESALVVHSPPSRAAALVLTFETGGEWDRVKWRQKNAPMKRPSLKPFFVFEAGKETTEEASSYAGCGEEEGNWRVSSAKNDPGGEAARRHKRQGEEEE